MRPHRARLVFSLVNSYGLGKQMQVFRPEPRTFDQLTEFHADGGCRPLPPGAFRTLRMQRSLLCPTPAPAQSTSTSSRLSALTTLRSSWCSCGASTSGSREKQTAPCSMVCINTAR